MSVVTIKRAGHIAIVSLNRPEKLNAVTKEMLHALIAAQAHEDVQSARAVVLRGEGRAFCAGLDVSNFTTMTNEDLLTRTQGDYNDYQAACLGWHDLPIPVIAALHHSCIGAGLQIALGADIRISSPDCALSLMEIKWGLVPDMGSMTVLPGLMCTDIIQRMVYTAEILDGQEGARIGLVTETAKDPIARATELAEIIASKSPAAVREAKRLMQAAPKTPRAELLNKESQAQTALIHGPEIREQVIANLEKRAAVFD